MDTAHRFAECSTAIRLKVGALIVKDDRIISIGYNGTPTGWSNMCERREFPKTDASAWVDPSDLEKMYPYTDELNRRYKLKTLPEVLHAEMNAISKLAKSNESGAGATMFCTHAPCIDCAKMIYQAGITTLYYDESYRSPDGLDFLKKAGVMVKQFSYK